MTNRLQDQASRSTKTQVEGANKAGAATKSFNDLVAQQVMRLAEAYQRTKILEEAQRRFVGMRPTMAPSVDEFRAMDAATAKTLGFGRAQQEVIDKGRTGLALLHQGWLRIAAGAAIAARTAGAVSDKYDEMKDRQQKGYRSAGAGAVTIEQALSASNVTDVEGITEEALGMKGAFTQEQLLEFVKQTVSHNPDVGDNRMRELLRWFSSTTTPQGGSETMARMSGMAPGASIGQLDRMVAEYMKGSGGRAMGQTESKTIQDLVDTGFFTSPQALAMVASMSAYERGGELGGVVEKLKPPKPTGNPIEDTAAAAKWQQTVGYLRGQPGGGDFALKQVAPELAGDLAGGALGRRRAAIEYGMTGAAPSAAWGPRGLRAQAELDERARERAVEVDNIPDAQGIVNARAEARRIAAIEMRRNAGARGELDRTAVDLIGDAAGAVGLGRAYNWYDRQLNGEGPAPSAPSRPTQVEIVNDRTIRHQTY